MKSITSYQRNEDLTFFPSTFVFILTDITEEKIRTWIKNIVFMTKNRQQKNKAFIIYIALNIVLKNQRKIPNWWSLCIWFTSDITYKLPKFLPKKV